MKDVSIERITEITPEIVDATRRLAEQLESPSQVTISEKYLQTIIDNPSAYWLMARRNNDAKYIGMAVLYMLHYPTNIRTSLENIVVDGYFRRQGIGTALCEEAKRISLEKGANSIRIAASKTNIPSNAMIEKAGFSTDYTMDHYEHWLVRGPRF